MWVGENPLLNDTCLLISISGEDHRFCVVPLFSEKELSCLGYKNVHYVEAFENSS